MCCSRLVIVLPQLIFTARFIPNFINEESDEERDGE